MDNYFLLAFVLWPLVVLLAALLNMLIWWTFSWTELIMDYVVGFVIGAVVYAYISGTTSWPVALLLVMSQGLLGVLRLGGFLADPVQFFWVSAGATLGATLLAAALDRGAVAAGKTMSFPRALLSLVILPFKAPFALLTSGVGLLIFLAGVVRSFFGDDGRVGFLAGMLYAEWDRSNTDGEWTTTIGCTTQSWKNKFEGVMEHELYHSRQYIYLHDWLIPAWVVGEVLRLIAGKDQKANPIERAAYTIDDHDTAAPAPAAPSTP